MRVERHVYDNGKGFTCEVAEPVDFEDELERALAERNRFPRGWLRDSDALTPLAFTGVPLIVFIALAVQVAQGGLGSYLGIVLAIMAICLAIVAVLVAVSIAIYRRHQQKRDPRDLFAAGGYLFSIGWIDDKKKYGDSGKGIIRIDVVRIDEARGYHNAKDGVVWIVPTRPGALRDIWRRGHRWDERRAIALGLLKKDIGSMEDTDPFVGRCDVFRAFFEEIGISVTESAEPVDFLAGTWRPTDFYDH